MLQIKVKPRRSLSVGKVGSFSSLFLVEKIRKIVNELGSLSGDWYVRVEIKIMCDCTIRNISLVYWVLIKYDWVAF